MWRLQCDTWTNRKAVIACRSKQVMLILFIAIKTWWRSRIYWLPWKIMLVHNISCPSNRCLVHVWCTKRTCTKFFQPWYTLKGHKQRTLIRGSNLKGHKLPFWISISLSDTFKIQMKHKKHSFCIPFISRREKDGAQSIISCMVYLIMVDMSFS